MRDAHPLRTTILLPRQIRKQVSRPSKHLMHETIPQTRNRAILCQLRKLNGICLCVCAEVPLDPALSGVRDERGVFLDIARRFVVLRVRDAPAVEGNEEEGMHDQSHRPV